MSSRVAISEIAKIHYGKSLVESQRDSNGSYLVYGSNGAVGMHSARIFDYPSLIIDRKGSVGEVIFAPDGGWAIDTTFYIELNDRNAVDLRYLFYALKSANLQKHTITTSIPGLNRDDVYRTKIEIPAIQEQRRIATILDKADAIRRKRRQAIDLMNDFLRSVFLEMFGDPVSNPKNWELHKLGEIGNVVTGNTPPRAHPEYYGSSIEWIKSDNINTPSHYLTKATEFLSDEGKVVGRAVPTGSILVTCIAGSPSCIGNAAFTDREVTFNQQINAVVPDESCNSKYLYALFYVGKKLIQAASTNSMKGMVSKTKFESIEVPVPPISLQNKFAKCFDVLNRSLDSYHSSLLNSNRLFDSLSGSLMNTGVER